MKKTNEFITLLWVTPMLVFYYTGWYMGKEASPNAIMILLITVFAAQSILYHNIMDAIKELKEDRNE